jgi:peptidoglycan/xylan/chitin deacetylase (PgdA/CDA1 family)
MMVLNMSYKKNEFWPPPTEGPPRNLVGYGRHVPKVTWPEEARIVISLCLNIEEGSERSFAAGDGINEPKGETSRPYPADVRDLATESVFEYGSRAGVFRILRLFDDYQIKCTTFAVAVALAINPEVAEWLIESGHEICSHGWRWSEQWTMSRNEERESIQRAIDLFEEVCGTRPFGWYSRWGPSINTRELLVEAGFIYDSDAYNDDLPYHVTVKGKKHLVIPYTLTHNDGRYVSGHYGGPADFLDYTRRAFDYLWEEGETHPRMMSIGLHPRWVGQPSRASALEDFIKYALNKGQVWFARRIDVANWWNDHYSSFER